MSDEFLGFITQKAASKFIGAAFFSIEFTSQKMYKKGLVFGKFGKFMPIHKGLNGLFPMFGMPLLSIY